MNTVEVNVPEDAQVVLVPKAQVELLRSWRGCYEAMLKLDERGEIAELRLRPVHHSPF